MPDNEPKEDGGEEKPDDVEQKYLKGLTDEEITALGLA